MNKIFLIITSCFLLGFLSCKKDNSKPFFDDFGMEVAAEEPNLILSSTGYEANIIIPLMDDGNQYYTSGAIEYKLNDEVVAVVDFASAADEKAVLTRNGHSSEFDLKKKKKNSKYKKVIVKPLIKTDDCKYIVEGMIKYYDAKTDEYVATIDYGNGVCDEWATKEWASTKKHKAGRKTFSLDDWYKKDGKK